NDALAVPATADRSFTFSYRNHTSTAGDRMSDMRNFSGNKEPIMSETIPETNLAGQPQFRDTGGLSHFHHSAEMEEAGSGSNTAKLIGAAVVVVLLCGAGAYAYMSASSTPAPKPAVATTSAPKEVAANNSAPAPEAAATDAPRWSVVPMWLPCRKPRPCRKTRRL